MKEEIITRINKDLYLQAKDELDMSFDEFVEYALTIYLSRDNVDEYARLFRKACKLYNDLDNVKQKLYNLSEFDDSDDYSKCIETVDRMHNRLGYVGRNQLRKIAKNNNVSPTGLINFIERTGEYDVRNFGDAPK